jgi:hypothetical protein
MLVDCTFTGNLAYGPGGALYDESSMNTLEACLFSKNMAAEPGATGGAVAMANDGHNLLTDCAFWYNSASAGGGAVANARSRTAFRRCIFTGNRVTEDTGDGGAVRISEIGTPVFLSCVFRWNWAPYGGAISNVGSSPMITNCTFCLNAADSGRALWITEFAGSTGETNVTNCVLWDGGNELSGRTEGLSLTYSNVQAWTQVGLGNLDSDPMFVRLPDPGPDGHFDGIDDDYGDLRLQVASPCVDSGTNTPPGWLPELDADGNPRIFNDTVDMGAYEYAGVSD